MRYNLIINGEYEAAYDLPDHWSLRRLKCFEDIIIRNIKKLPMSIHDYCCYLHQINQHGIRGGMFLVFANLLESLTQNGKMYFWNDHYALEMVCRQYKMGLCINIKLIKLEET